MTDTSTPLDTLSSLVHPQGGWGYAAGQPAHIEPTCLALLALGGNPERYRSQIDAGLVALQRHAAPDGSYRLDRGRPQAVWPTSLVLFTRAALGVEPASLRAISDRVLSLKGRVLRADPEMAEMTDINLGRVGWPWGEHNFAWVEPTAWACLAVRKVGKSSDPRVLEGLRLLIDRAFDEGGINYGNRLILGRMTEPIPGPTALMLLALQGYSKEARVASAARYLQQSCTLGRDLEHLCWARLALATVENVDPAFLQELTGIVRQTYDEQREGGRQVGIIRRALTALSLDADRYNPFRLLDAAASPALDSAGEVPAPDETEPRAGFLDRMKSRFRGFMMRGVEALRQPPVFGSVHIAKAESYDDDLTAVLKTQYEHFRPHLPFAGKRIVLKPNLVEWHRDKVINTDPRVVDAVIALCQAEGAAEVIVAEGPGHWRNVEFLVEQSGLGDVLRRRGVRFVDLNHDEPVKVLNLGRLTGLDYLYLTRTVISADVFISLPKLKTHHWAGATLSLKNLFGTLPGICYGWPKNELHWRGIPRSIIDIALTQTPHLAIVDGIIGMEGDGPLNGRAKHVGALIMGIDLVAVDSTCCRLMGLPPERVPTLRLGAAKRLGRISEAEIPQIGLQIAGLAQTFELPPKIESLLIPQTQSA